MSKNLSNVTAVRNRKGIVYAGSRAHSLVVGEFCLPYSHYKVKSRTDTLEVGSRAPEFSLSAANRDGVFTLSGLIARGPATLEFLRGTW